MIPKIPVMRCPPRKGGLPMRASKPPVSFLNTSGNSNGQWKGLRAGLSVGKSTIKSARAR
jgi:hypothetical protein